MSESDIIDLAQSDLAVTVTFLTSKTRQMCCEWIHSSRVGDVRFHLLDA